MIYSELAVPRARLPLDEAIELACHLKARMRRVHVVEPWVMVTRETMAANLQQIAELKRSGGAER